MPSSVVPQLPTHISVLELWVHAFPLPRYVVWLISVVSVGVYSVVCWACARVGATRLEAGLSLDVPAELIKDPRSWSVEDIAVWLHWLGIGEHAEAFAAQGIDGRCLLQLSAESAWAELGVVDPAQQRVLESAVEPLSNFHDSEGAESSLALHAIEGPVQGEVFYIGAGGITGGRHSASNGVVLSENYVSRLASRAYPGDDHRSELCESQGCMSAQCADRSLGSPRLFVRCALEA